jgi:subtilisin family serine protease
MRASRAVRNQAFAFAFCRSNWQAEAMGHARSRKLFRGILCCLLSLLSLRSTYGAPPETRADRFLAQPKTSLAPGYLSRFHTTHGCKLLRSFDRLRGLQVLEVPQGGRVTDLIEAYQASGLFEYVEPDYIGHTFATAPNDPLFTNGSLWALNNFGQGGGTPHADIDAVDAWDLMTSASNIIVAVLDTGIRYTHEDLAANMWVNPNDGSHGTNAVAGTTDPNDDTTHGTAVAGIIGAVGNNGKGMSGVAWRIKLMSCKCFNSSGNGTVSDAIACIDYARANGAQVINASFGFAASQSLSNAVWAARTAGIIAVAACGNSGADIDPSPPYPAGIRLDNVISVAFTTRNDTLAALSNYGATNVHLAAPGDQITSTFPATDSYYLAQSGSSFAAPYVAGACALVEARFPTETHQQIISRILNGTDPLPSLNGKCVTGGRLNVRKALSPVLTLAMLPAADNSFSIRVSGGPNRLFTVESSTNLLNWSSIATNTTSATGTCDFNDPGLSPKLFYRAVSTY